MNLQAELTAALTAARHAGELALSYQGRQVATELKNGLRDSPVTEADKAVDAYLYQTLTQAFPQDAWLSEEIPDDGSRFKRPRCWVVDPIDGTTGYLKWLGTGMPHDPTGQNRRQFSVSVALVEAGEPLLGVVYAPLRNQMVHAVRGQGVFFNGQPVSRVDTVTTLADATFLSSVSELRDGLVDDLAGQTRLQAYGSVAYKLALTALTNNVITASLKPKSAWDLAAGQLLCTEAGLTVTDLAGNPFRYDREDVVYPGLIAAPPGLYAQLRDILPTAPTGGYK